LGPPDALLIASGCAMHIHRIGDVTVLNDAAEILDSGSCPSMSLFFMTCSPRSIDSGLSAADKTPWLPLGHAGCQRSQVLPEGMLGMTMTGIERVGSIADVGVEDIALVGNKAATFAALRRAGSPVPEAVVLTTDGLADALVAAGAW
jgi:hypothetical protein